MQTKREAHSRHIIYINKQVQICFKSLTEVTAEENCFRFVFFGGYPVKVETTASALQIQVLTVMMIESVIYVIAWFRRAKGGSSLNRWSHRTQRVPECG